MGKLTQLHQGSLNGLRRQTNECLENAYNKGYQDGKKDLEESNGQAEYNKGYNDAINDYNMMFKYMFHNIKEFRQFLLDSKYYDTEMVIRGSSTASVLFDLICDFDIAEVISEFKKWQEEKKKAEEEIKVGDIVYYGEEMLKAIVLDIVTGQGVSYAIMLDENGLNVNEELSGLKFIEHTNEVEQLLDKMKE
jgi:hypothetical protein